MYRIVTRIVLTSLLAMVASHVLAAEVTVQPSPGGAVVKIDGELFTEYLIKSGTKPILWPIVGPTGKRVTRAYPMGELPGEEKDHPHQRSLWFTHGSVGGVSFWEESPKAGSIVHRKFVTLASAPKPAIVTENDWVAPGGKKICEDQRALSFGADAAARWIDFDITIKASEGALTFGDTKEGMFGIRVAESMKVEGKKGKKLGGKIVNSEGKTDASAWGRAAAWVDYHGPVEGQVLGIAVFNHPKSFRFPTYWHVRTYGLFAANPFGLHDFPGGEKLDGSHTVARGESIRFCYRVWLHSGDEKQGRVAEAYAAYAKGAK